MQADDLKTETTEISNPREEARKLLLKGISTDYSKRFAGALKTAAYSDLGINTKGTFDIQPKEADIAVGNIPSDLAITEPETQAALREIQRKLKSSIRKLEKRNYETEAKATKREFDGVISKIRNLIKEQANDPQVQIDDKAEKLNKAIDNYKPFAPLGANWSFWYHRADLDQRAETLLEKEREFQTEINSFVTQVMNPELNEDKSPQFDMGHNLRGRPVLSALGEAQKLFLEAKQKFEAQKKELETKQATLQKAKKALEQVESKIMKGYAKMKADPAKTASIMSAMGIGNLFDFSRFSRSDRKTKAALTAAEAKKAQRSDEDTPDPEAEVTLSEEELLQSLESAHMQGREEGFNEAAGLAMIAGGNLDALHAAYTSVAQGVLSRDAAEKLTEIIEAEQAQINAGEAPEVSGPDDTEPVEEDAGPSQEEIDQTIEDLGEVVKADNDAADDAAEAQAEAEEIADDHTVIALMPATPAMGGGAEEAPEDDPEDDPEAKDQSDAELEEFSADMNARIKHELAAVGDPAQQQPAHGEDDDDLFADGDCDFETDRAGAAVVSADQAARVPANDITAGVEPATAFHAEAEPAPQAVVQAPAPKIIESVTEEVIAGAPPVANDFDGARDAAETQQTAAAATAREVEAPANDGEETSEAFAGFTLIDPDDGGSDADKGEVSVEAQRDQDIVAAFTGVPPENPEQGPARDMG